MLSSLENMPFFGSQSLHGGVDLAYHIWLSNNVFSLPRHVQMLPDHAANRRRVRPLDGKGTYHETIYEKIFLGITRSRYVIVAHVTVETSREE